MKKNYRMLSIIITLILLSNVLSLTPIESKMITGKIETPLKKYEDFFRNRDSLNNKNDKIPFARGEMIVKFKNRNFSFTKDSKNILFGVSALDKLNKEYTLKSINKIFDCNRKEKFEKYYKLIFPENVDILNLINEYNKIDIIEYAEPNYFYKYCVESNDPLFQKQWSLNNIAQNYPWDGRSNPPPGTIDCDIDAPEAWEITKGSKEIVIAVIDTGVDYNHPDLSSNIWINENEIPNNGIDDDRNGYIDDIKGWDFKENDNDPMDEKQDNQHSGHGTFCAGLISAVGNNSKGISGINWNSKIMSIKTPLHSTYISEAITYAADNGADVISMSYGGYSYSELQKDALDYAYNKGIVLVASAGNDNNSRLHYPSGYKNVISVAATDSNDNKAEFSNYGPWIDFAAPGVDLLSLRAEGTDMYGNETNIFDEKYYIGSGTSFASPFVAGLAGLLLSYNNTFTPDMIKTIISNSVDNSTSKYNIGGRINAHKALLKKPAVAILDQYVDWRNIKGEIQIKGSATGKDFERYVIKYGVGENPNEWSKIFEGNHPIKGVLSTFDTTILNDGVYTISLNVYCNDDEYTDKIYLIINNDFNKIYVDDDNNYGPWTGSIVYPFQKIQEGINNAGDKDTVFVVNGTYNENVKIIGEINLIGEDRNNTIIDSNNSNSPISILSDNILFENFSIQDVGKKLSEPAIQFGQNLESVTIKNNIVKNCRCGIWIIGGNDFHNIIGNILENSSIILIFGPQNNIISNNLIKNSKKFDGGIGLSISYFNTIKENTITGHTYGILIAFSIMNKIISNNITDNDIGLEFVVWGVHKIYNNNFIDNKVHAKCIASNYNKWNGNYWDNWIGLKKPYLKFLPKFIPTLIPKVFTSFDWNPVSKPYNI